MRAGRETEDGDSEERGDRVKAIPVSYYKPFFAHRNMGEGRLK